MLSSSSSAFQHPLQDPFDLLSSKPIQTASTPDLCDDRRSSLLRQILQDVLLQATDHDRGSESVIQLLEIGCASVLPAPAAPATLE